MTKRAASIELPKPVERYLAAEKAKDVETQVRCFTDDALVHDEDRDYRGPDAIRDWKRDVHAKFEYEVEPLAAATEENICTVLARLTGNFPGSPVELDFRFTLANDKISSLVIE